MTGDEVDAYCASLPGTDMIIQWADSHIWKVGGKVFVIHGPASASISVKTDSVETAQMLIDAGIGIKAPYCHRSWLNLQISSDAEEIRHRIASSYRLIRAKLTKKAQAALPPLTGN